MITVESIFNKGKNKHCLNLGNRLTLFKKKSFTTILICIELNKYKDVWKGEKFKFLGTAIATLFLSYIKLKQLSQNGGILRNRIALFIFAFTVILITIFVFFTRKSTNESANFSVPSQRVNSGKSAATTQKWDGMGKIADMIWE